MKSSMKNWRQNRMKHFWLHTLLRTYSSVMIIIIASFAILLSYADWDSREKEAQRVAQRVTARTVSEIEYYHRESTQIAQALVENQARIEGIYKYFSLSMPDYFYWQLERKASPYISVSLYENVDDLYVRNDFVTGVAIAFQDYKEVYVSTKDKRSGEKIRAEDFKLAGNSFAIPVSDPVSDQDLGVIYISLDPAVLYHAIDNTRGHTPMAVTVTSPFDTEIFHIGETVDKESENWLVGLTSHGYQVQVAVPKNFVLQGTVTSSALIVGLSLLFIVILYLTLRQTFANYQKQVVDLVDSIQAIAQGQEGLRIDTLEKDQELLLIAETTNDMLDRLEKNIHDIYQLELSQKDANMRALQAQINPHFMYNTLEFLRMYAVMQSQDELADIIYEFSSLLRNNISDERETLLKQELEFCRKYSYLCMVRYPKSIAYGFKIDPELENMKIPKFTLQPLVENYFAHGVDHRRTDNVISIKALKQDGFVEILVVDNGRGMSAEKLANIREKLSQRYFEHQASYSDQRQSIGIVNVHERFVLYFGDRYAITIESAEQAGVQYRITIQDE
ncbi:sensor histidine kinase [Streptococcus pneumoniae]|nr:sensor histidine kinase [Streptococcus pneumoniae]CWK38439.1 sensor histidine kinase [Streptococcus pneumoniae]VKT99177.1 sensor histidine kinase [Streptococcus pneumoniae]VLK19338.1 sensor histidine kinase [Streptococcus pneumoniae]VMZ92692.1 sensor histidine kinase [Streptococcus pneumoniae]